MHQLEDEKWSIDMSCTVDGWEENLSNDELEEIAIVELSPHAIDFAAGGIRSGGHTKDEDVAIDSISAVGDELRIEFTVVFYEVIGSSCKDFSTEEQRDRRLGAVLQNGATVAVVEPTLSDLSRLSIADRNSAADGR